MMISPESQQVPALAVERQALAHELPVLVEGSLPDGGVVALLGDEELGEKIVLETNHGTDVVPAERVIQVESDAVVIVHAERAPGLGHSQADAAGADAAKGVPLVVVVVVHRVGCGLGT